MNNIEEFLNRHEASRFRHCEELIPGIKSGLCTLQVDLESTPVPCSRLLSVYRRRAGHLEHSTTDHARSLQEDVLTLCRELEKTPDELVQLWCFFMPPDMLFSVFESATSLRIVGCVRAVDDR